MEYGPIDPNITFLGEKLTNSLTPRLYKTTKYDCPYCQRKANTKSIPNEE